MSKLSLRKIYLTKGSNKIGAEGIHHLSKCNWKYLNNLNLCICSITRRKSFELLVADQFNESIDGLFIEDTYSFILI